ncbi:MAG TPA: PP2C family serine/threonine-protein phosphatase [Motilibacterales bacterium]|nr:PP2C family serine/threonine-protein phosphatase [Motilibacterales bacterium]
MTQFLRYAAKSDVGMVRTDNEDSGYAGRTLLVVADGMGGHAAGELASSTAVATLAELDSEDLPTGDVLTALDDAMLTSAERIAQFIQADPSRAGMGTTLTAVLWRGGRIALIHVGDSRAYLLRDGELSQITHDHTYVQTLIDAGRITAEEARTHPKRNLLLRAIDGTGVPQGETSIREARVGDRYLLCSDGLCGVVTDAAIEAVMAEVSDLTAAVTELVELALAAGAPDNVTAVLADVIEVADADHDLESALGGPVVVGAAGDRRNRAALPGLLFPDDVGPGSEGSDAGSPGGPAVAGGLVTRSQARARSGSVDEPETSGATEGDSAPDATGGGPGVPAEPVPGSLGAAVAAGELPVGGPAGAAVATVGAPEDSADEPGWVRRHWRGLSVVAGVAGVLLIGTLGFLWWLSSQWFVGPNGGYVAVFQGIPQQAAGIPLSRVTTRTALLADTLPYYDQAQLDRTLEAATQAEAQRIVVDLEAKAAACSSVEAPLGCPPAPPGAGGTGAGVQPSGSPTTSPGTPSPSATPSLGTRQ